MPEMCGTDLIREITLRSPQTACILMTGGVGDFAEVPPGIPLLRKPVSGRDLIAAVDEAIRQSAELRATLRASQAEHLELRKQYKWLKAEHEDIMRDVAKKFADPTWETRLNRLRNPTKNH
jgi:FixJ family two-component response regulator